MGCGDIPWSGILTSAPVWAIVVAHSGNNFGFYLLLTEMPTYLRTILGFPIEEVGEEAISTWYGLILHEKTENNYNGRTHCFFRKTSSAIYSCSELEPVPVPVNQSLLNFY